MVEPQILKSGYIDDRTLDEVSASEAMPYVANAGAYADKEPNWLQWSYYSRALPGCGSRNFLVRNEVALPELAMGARKRCESGLWILPSSASVFGMPFLL